MVDILHDELVMKKKTIIKISFYKSNSKTLNKLKYYSSIKNINSFSFLFKNIINSILEFVSLYNPVTLKKGS